MKAQVGKVQTKINKPRRYDLKNKAKRCPYATKNKENVKKRLGKVTTIR